MTCRAGRKAATVTKERRYHAEDPGRGYLYPLPSCTLSKLTFLHDPVTPLRTTESSAPSLQKAQLQAVSKYSIPSQIALEHSNIMSAAHHHSQSSSSFLENDSSRVKPSSSTSTSTFSSSNSSPIYLNQHIIRSALPARLR